MYRSLGSNRRREHFHTSLVAAPITLWMLIPVFTQAWSWSTILGGILAVIAGMSVVVYLNRDNGREKQESTRGQSLSIHRSLPAQTMWIPGLTWAAICGVATSVLFVWASNNDPSQMMAFIVSLPLLVFLISWIMRLVGLGSAQGHQALGLPRKTWLRHVIGSGAISTTVFALLTVPGLYFSYPEAIHLSLYFWIIGLTSILISTGSLGHFLGVILAMALWGQAFNSSMFALEETPEPFWFSLFFALPIGLIAFIALLAYRVGWRNPRLHQPKQGSLGA